MWRLTWVRDWCCHQVDRFVDYWIRRASDRVMVDVERWLEENRDRD